MYNLEKLINSITPVTVGKNHFKLHPMVAPLLHLIMIQIDNLFRRTSRKIIEYTPSLSDYFNYYKLVPTSSLDYLYMIQNQ